MSADPDKPRFPRAIALEVAEELHSYLAPYCERIAIVGSVRRGKEMVGDLELLYISKTEERTDPGSLLGDKIAVLAAHGKLDELVKARIILPRPKSDGTKTWGNAIRLAAHCQTVLPVDFFRATPESWWNLMVCRTGGAATNMRIATKARELGLQWNPSINSSGFTRLGTRGGEGKGGRVEIKSRSEEDVFNAVGMPFLPPWRRE